MSAFVLLSVHACTRVGGGGHACTACVCVGGVHVIVESGGGPRQGVLLGADAFRFPYWAG